MAADTLSRVFSALADPTRRNIVARLAEGDATVGQLAEPYQMTLQAVYKHLRVLEDAGLVSRAHGPQPRPVHLETKVFDVMDDWMKRYRRLDAVLAEINETDDKDRAHHDQDHRDHHRSRPEAADHPYHS